MRIIIISIILIVFLTFSSYSFISNNSEQIVSPVHAELDKNAFENCEIGKYRGSFGLGSWSVSIETKENEKCFMTVFTDMEGGYSESVCILEIGKFRASDWNTTLYPLEGVENNCLRIKSGSVLFANSHTTHYSPKQQVDFGILPKFVLCKNGLELIFKIENNSPACVQPSTANILVDRGWGKFGEVSIKIITDKNEYKIGETVRITILNEGAKILFPEMTPQIVILDEEKNTLMEGGVNDQAYFLKTDTSITFWWPQNVMVPGNYTIKTQFLVNDLPYEVTYSVPILELNDVILASKPLQECSYVPGKEIACPDDFVCYEDISGGLGPPGTHIPIESIGGDKLCHKECETDNDCPSNAPFCELTEIIYEDTLNSFYLCFSEDG